MDMVDERFQPRSIGLISGLYAAGNRVESFAHVLGSPDAGYGVVLGVLSNNDHASMPLAAALAEKAQKPR
jgi:hypothetical protein